MIISVLIMFLPVNDEYELRSRLAQIVRTMAIQVRDDGFISPVIEDHFYSIYNQLIALDPDQYT